jgi:hypothetical protein
MMNLKYGKHLIKAVVNRRVDFETFAGCIRKN